METFERVTAPIINWAIVKQPLNWIIIPLVIILGGISLGLIFHPANADNGDGQ